MKIRELLDKNTINLDLKVKNKLEVVDKLVDLLDKAGKLNDKEVYKKAVLDREALSSTGIGENIAIPHGKSSGVKKASLALGIVKSGVDYDSLDGEPVNIVFMIAADEHANNEHLETLSKLSVLLMNEDFKKGLLSAKTSKEVFDLLDRFEEKDEIEEIVEVREYSKRKYIIAVTACPTGIAHTYMAADSLKKKAEALGYDIKVETNGSTGIKNAITKEDIDSCDGIIVAADKQVELSRFNGKRVVICPVVQGMKNPEKLINESISGNAQVLNSSGTSSGKSGVKQKSGFYKHIMSGVSNMLPFVVGGGILIAISFMFGINSADPSSAEFNKFAALLKDIGGGNAFGLMIPVLAAFIGQSIADRPGFAPAMVGGLIASTSGAGFLGGLIAGFLAGYIVLGLKKAFAFLPESLDGIKPVLIYPLLGIFLTGMIMFVFVVGPASALNLGLENWLATLGTGNKVILGLVLGGMMAVDMGGPLNKAAYAFGIALVSAGDYYPMAAIMAGGMVPPLGTAIATTLFKNKFSADERKAGITNYIMGACFITEGAIPFAAADPMRVIPASVVGAGIAGALAMLAGIQLPAPHGGAFVIGVVIGNPLFYIGAILAGSVITGLLIGMLKKKVV